MARPKGTTKLKPKAITLYKARLFLNKVLTEGECLSKVDGMVLNEIMFEYPSLYIQFADKLYNGSKIPL